MASAIPEVTGRAVWAGHDSWTPDASARGDTLRQLFDGTLSDREGRRALVGTGATFAVAPCGTSNRFTAYLPPDAAVVAAHGCVRVYAF